jgi:hypothetical protein
MNIIKNKQKLTSIVYNFNLVKYLIRYFAFAIYSFLSFRIIFVTLYQSSQSDIVFILICSVATVYLVLRKIELAVLSLPLVITLFSGFQRVGLYAESNIIDFYFSVLFLTWLCKRLFTKQTIQSPTGVGYLIDFFAGLVAISLIMSMWQHSFNYFITRVFVTPFPGMDDGFYAVHAVFIILTGMIFLRIMELEIPGKTISKKYMQVFYILAAAVIVFSIIQLAFNLPRPIGKKLWGVFSPYDDVHSYTSFVVLLFFIIVSGIKTKNGIMQNAVPGFLCCTLLILIFLAGSRTGVLVFLVIGALYLFYIMSSWQFAVLIITILGIVFYVNLTDKTAYQQITGLNKYLSGNTSELIGSRYAVLFEPSSFLRRGNVQARIILWERSLNMIQKHPITGTGIGSFYRVSPQYHNKSKPRWADYRENCHNYYLQLISELGILGFVAWSSILAFLMLRGLTLKIMSGKDQWKRLNTGLLVGILAYLATMLTSHPLLLSSQQILFWFALGVFVLNSNSDSTECQNGIVKKTRIGMFNFRYGKMLFLGLFFSIYIFSFIIELGNQPKIGFYHIENWNGKKMRWTRHEANQTVDKTGQFLQFETAIFPYNIPKNGLELKILINNELFEKVKYYNAGWRKHLFYLPFEDGKINIKLVASHTFIPYVEGLNSDIRSLGVAVSEFDFSDNLESESDIGF